MLKKTRAKRKYKQGTEPVITSYPSTDAFSKPVLSNTLAFKKKKTPTQPRRRVCDCMCPRLSADILQRAMSVCERETDKKGKKKKERAGEWKVKTEENEQWKQAEGEQRGDWQSRARKCCMCVGSQPCQAPVSRWFMAPRLGAVSSASSVLLLLTANEAGRAFKHST